MDTPENYFVLKQLQHNIYKTFKVKQSSRSDIVSQIKLLLEDNFPKVILRTDIKSFYESIPHEKLIFQIEENSLLNSLSRKIIKNILAQYCELSHPSGQGVSNIGLPRGIGISAYLAELYLKDMDKIIASIPTVSYYARYVDDIIVIYTPTPIEDRISVKYKEEIKNVVNRFGLEINEEKTEVFDFRKIEDAKGEITYLGYRFILEKTEKIKIRMSKKKLKRFSDKIHLSFQEFERDRNSRKDNEYKSNKRLLQRIKILTHNFRLTQRKRNVLAGVYFSNQFLTPEYLDLKVLDRILQCEIDRHKDSLLPVNEKKLRENSFVNSFKKQDKHFLHFYFQRSKPGRFNINRILNIWKDL